jgi:hypothetical protein
MKTFLLDLLEDLREKRLLPVAVVLAIGIVAVPVVLAKGSSSGSDAPGVAAKSSANSDATAAQRRIAALVQGGGKGTDLGKFGSKDPFKPPSGFSKAPPSLASLGSTGKTTGSTPKPSTGATTTPSTGGGSTGGSNGGGSTGGSRKTVAYTYVADVTFSHNGKSRQRKLGRLAMLPSASNPLLLFLGVTAEGGNAVFLVDSSLKAVGEGKCTPSHDQCANVYLGPGAEEEFTNADGESYTLRIDEIRKVTVASQARAAKKAAKAARRKRAHASTGSAAPRFVPPLLVDVIETSSSSAKGGR